MKCQGEVPVTLRLFLGEAHSIAGQTLASKIISHQELNAAAGGQVFAKIICSGLYFAGLLLRVPQPKRDVDRLGA